MSSVGLHGISKSFGGVPAVRNVDLTLGDGEFVTLLGASGSGKTTCLRMVAGFLTPSAGRIRIGGRDVTADPPYRRNIGMVFQSYALFPHLSVAQNVAFGLRIKKLPAAEIDARSREALSLVRMEAFGSRYPHQLSGGQRQRVALARAVVIRPEILLLDEPLSALDFKLREELRGEIRAVQKSLGITTLFVTHDQDEALTVSDRIVVMRDGAVVQVDTPTGLYRHPCSAYVANFVGRTNFLEALMIEPDSGDGCHVVEVASLKGARLRIEKRSVTPFIRGERCLLGFRPEDARLEAPGADGVAVRIDKVEYIGSSWLVGCAAGGGGRLLVSVPSRAEVPPVGGEAILSWRPDSVMLLKSDS